jgi:hypothetical protein
LTKWFLIDPCQKIQYGVGEEEEEHVATTTTTPAAMACSENSIKKIENAEQN